MKKIAVFFLSVLLLSLAFLPQILSLKPFQTLWIPIIEKKLHASIEIENASFSWTSLQRFRNITLKKDKSLELIQIKEMKISQPLWGLSKWYEKFEIIDAKLTIPDNSSSQITNINVESNRAELSLNGRSSNGGALNCIVRFPASSDFQIQFSCKNFTTYFLNFFTSLHLPEIIGNTMTSAIDATYKDAKGTFAINLQSQNINLAASGEILNNQLTLTKLLTFNMLCEKECLFLLNNMIPKSIGEDLIFYNPISFKIGRENFSYDNNVKNLTSLEIQDGFLDLGQFSLTAGATLQPLSQLLPKSNDASKFDFWVTPIDFSLQKGLLHLQRLDILLNGSLHVFTWGTIDVMKNQLDLTLAVPASSLRNFSKLSNLPPNYNFLIQISGPLDKPNVSIKTAVAKITALMSAKALGKQFGGKAGKIFGNILDQVSNNQNEVPPQRRPLPWAK